MPRYRQQPSTFQQRAVTQGGGSLPTDLQAMNQATEREIFAREQMDAEMRSKNLAIDTVQNEEGYYRDKDRFEREDLEREALELGRQGALEDLASLDPTADDYSDRFTQTALNAPQGMMNDPVYKHIADMNIRANQDFRRSQDSERSKAMAVEAGSVANSRVLSATEKSIAGHDIVANTVYDREPFRKSYTDSATQDAYDLYNAGVISEDHFTEITQQMYPADGEPGDIGYISGTAEDLAEKVDEFKKANGDAKKERLISYKFAVANLDKKAATQVADLKLQMSLSEELHEDGKIDEANALQGEIGRIRRNLDQINNERDAALKALNSTEPGRYSNKGSRGSSKSDSTKKADTGTKKGDTPAKNEINNLTL